LKVILPSRKRHADRLQDNVIGLHAAGLPVTPKAQRHSEFPELTCPLPDKKIKNMQMRVPLELISIRQESGSHRGPSDDPHSVSD